MMRKKGNTNSDQLTCTDEWEAWWNSGAFLQQVIYHSGIGFVLISEEGICLRANGGLCQVLGYSENGLEGIPLESLLHPDNSGLIPEKVGNVEPGETDYHQEEVRCLQADGNYRWFRASLCATCFGDNQSIYYSLLLEDIQDSIQNRQELIRKEKDYYSIAENSPDVITRYDMDGRRIYENKQFENITNLKSMYVLGATLDEVGSLDAGFSLVYKRKLARVLNEKVATDFEIHGTEVNNERRYYQIKLVPEYNVDGEMVGVLGFGYDITSRKTAEEALWENRQLLPAVMDNIPQAIFWKDRNLVYLGCNRAFARDASFSTPEEVVGKTDYDFPMSGEQADLYRNDDRSVLESGEPKLGYEERVNTPDGSQIWVRTSKIPMQDAKGNIAAVLGTYEDITERKLSEEKLYESEKRFRTLYNDTPALQYSIDREGKLVDVSDYWLAVMGYNREEVIGRKSTDFLTEKSREYAKEVVLPEFMKTGSCFDIEYRYVKKSGEVIDCLLSATSEKDPDGKILRSLAVITDITERKQMEIALALREQEFRSLAESSPDFIIRYDKEHCMRYLNGNLLHRLMIENVDDVLGKCPVEVWPDGRYAAIDKAAQQALENGGMVTIEMCVSNEKGEDDCLDIYVVPERNVQGEIIGTIAFGQDITKRKQVEREREQLLSEVQQSEELLHAVIDNMPSPVFLKDKEGHYLLVNSAFCEYLGKTEEELIGKTVFDLSTDKKLASRYHKMDMVLVQSKDVQIYESEVKYADGSLHQVMFRKAPFTAPDGEVGGLIGIMLDITEMKLKEEILQKKQALLEEAQLLGHIGSWELDLVTGKREWSTELYRIFEVDQSGTLPLNEVFIRLVHPADRGKVNDIYKKLGKELDKYEVEFRLLFPDGHEKYVVEKGITEFDNTGTPLRYLGTVQNITERKEYELQLWSALEQAEESSRLKSSFLAIISHEIRTPLNAIWGFTNLLGDEFITPEERKEFQKLVKSSVDKLTVMLDSIINLANIETGNISVNPSVYNPKQLIQEKYNRLLELCDEYGKNQLKVEIGDYLPECGQSCSNDQGRIGQVFDILIDNAVKFTEKGSITIGGRLLEDNRIEFFVSDTGIGIPKEKHQTIFDSFVQTDNTNTRHYEGLGIGLSVARKIANAIGGDLNVISEPGKGSTFSLQLPCVFNEEGKQPGI